MALNLIKRKIKIQKIPRSYDKVEKFYIVWNRDDDEYYLSDANLDGTSLLWHKNMAKGVSFTDGDEALAFCKEVNNSRPFAQGIIELKIVTQNVRSTDDETWMI